MENKNKKGNENDGNNNERITLGEKLARERKIKKAQEHETLMGSESLNLTYEIGKGLLTEVDKIAANGIVRTSLAVREHKDEVLKKVAYLGLSVIAKNVLTSLTDSSIIETACNTAIAVTGASAAYTAHKVVKTAWSYDDEAVKAHRRELETAKGGEVKTFEHLE